MRTLSIESTSSRVRKPTNLSELLEAFYRRHLNKVSSSTAGRDMRYRRAKRFVEWSQNVGLAMCKITGWEVET